jgi:hypothetical protein
MTTENFLEAEGAIIARIRDNVPELAACGSYLTLTSLGHSALSFPSAWVGFGGYQLDGAPLAGGAVQQIRQVWNVTLIVKAEEDVGDGALVRSTAGELITQILKLLMGWKPGDRFRPLELVNAPDPDYGDGVGLFHFSFAFSMPFSNR